jgi:hypothetical protein
MAPLEKADLLQGTLDLLILKVVALGPVHGYGICNGFARSRLTYCRCSRDRCIRRCTAWRSATGWKRTGANQTVEGRRSSIGFQRRAGNNWPLKRKRGTGSRGPWN